MFQDINGIALNLGNAEQEGAAEHAVLRCKFLRCGEGISTINWNTLDIYVWYCLFEDCGSGIVNRMGGFQAYENVFLRSKTVDVGTGSACTSLVNNISIGAKAFALTGYSDLYLRGNKIYDTVDPIAFSHGGNLTMLDNLIAGKPGVTGGLMEAAPSGLLVGNTFTTAWPVRPRPVRFNHADGGSYVVGHPIENMLDGNPDTSFRTGLWEKRAPGIDWLCPPGKPATVVRYTIASAADGDANDDPKALQLRGSNDWGRHWSVLDEQPAQTWNARKEVKEFRINAPQPFAMYQLVVSETRRGYKPGVGGFLSLGKVAFYDAKDSNIMTDPAGLLLAAQEVYGSYEQLEQKFVAPEKLPAPAEVRLPATPPNRHRKIFEMRPGTGDDARELQAQINAAAKQPAGSKPVVHVPKGNFTLQRTVSIPARCDVQLIGDGVGDASDSELNYAGGAGPLLRLDGPSRATLRDLDLNGGNQNGVDALVVTMPISRAGASCQPVASSRRRRSAHGGDRYPCRWAGAQRRDHALRRLSVLPARHPRARRRQTGRGRHYSQPGGLPHRRSRTRFAHVRRERRRQLVGEACWYEGDWDYPAGADRSPGHRLGPALRGGDLVAHGLAETAHGVAERLQRPVYHRRQQPGRPQ